MEPRTVRKSTIYQLLLSGVGAVLILVIGFLWYQNSSIISNVQAQCVRLEDKKADKEMLNYIIEQLNKIDKKLDDM